MDSMADVCGGDYWFPRGGVVPKRVAAPYKSVPLRVWRHQRCCHLRRHYESIFRSYLGQRVPQLEYDSRLLYYGLSHGLRAWSGHGLFPILHCRADAGKAGSHKGKIWLSGIGRIEKRPGGMKPPGRFCWKKVKSLHSATEKTVDKCSWNRYNIKASVARVLE